MPMEEALLRVLVERDPVSAAALSWIVTGAWPQQATQPLYDVAYSDERGPQLCF